MINLNKAISTPLALIIIIGFGILVVGSIVGYQYYYLPEQEIETSIIQVPKTETAKTEFTTDKTIDIEEDNLKIYRNEKYGFEFEYPADWLIDTQYPGIIGILSPEGIPFRVNYCDSVCWKQMKQEWNVETIKDYINLNSGILEETTISGKKAYKWIFVSSNIDYVIYVESGDGFYILQSSGKTKGNSVVLEFEDPQVENIIDSFKFID